MAVNYTEVGVRNELTNYNWLSDERFAKLKGQTTMRIQALLSSVYAMHGYDVYAPAVAREIMGLVEETWDIVRGKEKPLPEIDLNKWSV